MALETNTPQLTLEHMSLGSRERLEAGIRAGIVRNLTAGYQAYSLCLFSGRRPTPEEIKNGIYLFQGSDPSSQFCGVYNISPDDFVELAAESEFALAGRDLSSNEVFAGKNYPSNPTGFVDHESQVVFHHKFRKHRFHFARGNSIGIQAAQPIKDLGNGAAPTWAVLYPWGTRDNLDEFFQKDGNARPNEAVTTFSRRDGKSIKLAARAIRPECNMYLTVGDIQDEPTANLVLRKGAERGLDNQPRSIAIHRLKYSMPRMKTAPITTQGG